MKLISEYVENELKATITEDKESGKKKYVIEGVFAQAEEKNRNGRMYPKPIMEKAVNKYVTEQVKSKRAVGELNHPDGPTVNLDKVSHIITDMRFEGNNVVGKASILPTPMGKIVEGLLDGGVQLGVSTRGMGSLQKQGDMMVVKDDYILNTVDIVQDPSAPQAFVNGIMEGVEWVWNNGILESQVIEKIETEIKQASKSNRPAIQQREFKNFLSLLKQSL
ncbi:MAG: primosomal protein [Gammaproteobacteria bacterium TMED36]|nr:MAG: primosomal protein [Gammaproteobacteria bacterium TMED36]OUT94624.1 MAG: primosomal protein [Gammaproteobacteria bacterium TMED36]|tara:strand:+ start:1572 stop:2234 length:663 start_codon:yes stop_codon:yes gene_type:complete